MTKRERQEIRTVVGYDYQRLVGYESTDTALNKLDLWEAEMVEAIQLLQAEKRAIQAEKRRRIKEDQEAREAKRILKLWEEAKK